MQFRWWIWASKSTGSTAAAVYTFRIGTNQSTADTSNTQGPGWVGRYQALKSELKTVGLTLAGAYKFNSMFSVGASVIYQRADAEPLPLQGEAQSVVLAGSLINSSQQTAYITTGSYGLAIVDTSNFKSPVVLALLSWAARRGQPFTGENGLLFRYSLIHRGLALLMSAGPVLGMTALAGTARRARSRWH